MSKKPKYYIVEAAALPDVFLKVAEAKRLLESGEATTVGEATKLTGISRSAFYKYKDAVRPFHDMLQGRIVTMQMLLRDEPGALSGVLNTLADTGVNVLTINQNLPVNGCAVVTITAETSRLEGSMEDLLRACKEAVGVVKCEILAG